MAAQSEDRWIKMLDAMIRRADYQMRLQGSYVQSAMESHKPSDVLAGLEMDHAASQAVLNVVSVLKAAYVRSLERGRSSPDVDALIMSAASAFKEMVVRQKARAA